MHGDNETAVKCVVEVTDGFKVGLGLNQSLLVCSADGEEEEGRMEVSSHKIEYMCVTKR